MTKKSDSVPCEVQEKYAKIVALTDEFSQQYLNEEYTQLIRLATATLSRTPLLVSFFPNDYRLLSVNQPYALTFTTTIVISSPLARLSPVKVSISDTMKSRVA